jgi:hypothetical protein
MNVHPYAELMHEYHTTGDDDACDGCGDDEAVKAMIDDDDDRMQSTHEVVLDETVAPTSPPAESYLYPPSIQEVVSKTGTYWNSLNPANSAKLQALEEWMASNDNRSGSNGSALYVNSLHPKLVLLRYLRANHFDVEKTMEHISCSLEWRHRMQVPLLLQQHTPEQLLGCAMEKVTNVFPHWHSGYDKTGRPVLYKQYGKFEATLLKKLTGRGWDGLIQMNGMGCLSLDG